MKKISIIVPIYNAASTLHRCIGSVLVQDYNNWELILVNDGSADASPEICEEFAKKEARIVYISIENKGPSKARNLAIEACTGEFVCFIDADDYVTSDYISALCRPFENPKVQMSFAGYYEVSKQHPVPSPYHELKKLKNKKIIDSKIFRRKLLFGTTGIICSKMFVTDIIKQNGLQFIEDLKLHEDLVFTLQYSKLIKNIAIVDEHLYYYDRSNEHSLSSVKDEIFLENSYLSNDYIRTHYPENNIDAIISERKKAALLAYFDYMAVSSLPRRATKIQAIKKVVQKCPDAFVASPSDNRTIAYFLNLLDHKYFNIFIYSRQALKNWRKIRNI